MGADVYWSDFYHRVIILEFAPGWTCDDYSNLMRESVNMLNSVRHKVAIVIDFSQSTDKTFILCDYRNWLDTIRQWRNISNYADFWINVNPNPWESVIIKTIGLVYNPSNIVVNENVDSACSLAIEMLDKMNS